MNRAGADVQQTCRQPGLASLLVPYERKSAVVRAVSQLSVGVPFFSETLGRGEKNTGKALLDHSRIWHPSGDVCPQKSFGLGYGNMLGRVRVCQMD
jgi:hypothetical protein